MAAGVCIALLLLPWLLWLIRPPDTLRTLVYDKTVPEASMRQHVGLMWFLRHSKARDTGGHRFITNTSYRGYHPDMPEGERIEPLDPIPPETDIIHIVDTYGVYREGSGFSRNDTDGMRNLIYGGTTEEDVRALREFLNRDGPNTVVAEYNTFGTPTPGYVQARMYEMFRVRWTGWTGQYVTDLSRDGETPSWIFDRHEEQTGETWSFGGSGFVLYNIDEEILVLEMGTDIESEGNQFAFTGEGNELLGLSGSTCYNRIFDIVEPLAGSEVLATYTLDVTEPGAAKLQQFGLAESFPAVVLGRTAYHSTYYLAGNWADSPAPLRFSFLAGIPTLMKRVTNDTMSSENVFYWQTYIPLMEAIAKEARNRKATPIPNPAVETADIDGTRLVSRTQGNMLQIWQDGQWRDLFIHGVNIGIATPGHWFTEFPRDTSVYYRWLSQIGGMGANTVRIYTLLDPEFYKAFALYNQLHADTPLWLMQEIWPEEEPHGNDYLDDDYQAEYEREIRWVVDAMHGNADIPERRGRAWGAYTADVSPYILGYLVGRELEPIEVEDTNLLNAGYAFSGKYLKSHSEANPTEAWLAESTDYVVAYQQETYGWQHPVAIVNWPPLDMLDHESERNEQGEKIREYNDRTTVDINHILPGPSLKAGIFGAYHIYPNYPDFMNNDPLYDEYYDGQGRFRYGGYLKQFMEHHRAYPAVVAEFGLATGMGNAHISPDGYHHGSMTEAEQGAGIIRMYEAMEREGYAGGIIFEWMDEWAKKAWTTEPYMIPYDRQILWHNTVDPEQNYGILAYEAVKPQRAASTATGDGAIVSAQLRLDASYLHMDITLRGSPDFTKERLLIGIDTYARDRGELLYDPAIHETAPSGMEYLVVLDGKETSRLLAAPPSNYAAYRYGSHGSLVETGLFESMEKLINKARALEDGTPIPAKYEDSSALRYGMPVGSTNHWIVNGNTITLRIPWTRINVSDPSEGRVLDDDGIYHSDPMRDRLETAVSEGIAVSAILVQNHTGNILGTLPQASGSDLFVLPWNSWNQPVFQERLKESYPLLRMYFSPYERED